ncbi:MAG: O-antigen ligase family protein [Nitratireductor sp.]|nr:O-antigen ligase family protein [Nitratireductor sp.]
MFFGAELVSGLVNWNGSATVGQIGANVAFLGVLPIYALIVQSRERLLRHLLMAAPWCALAALALAALQQFVLDFRPQGGDGNAGVFAVTTAILMAFTLANALANALEANRPRSGILGSTIDLAGVFAAAATLILSSTRALWPSLAIFPLILWLVTLQLGESRLQRRIMAFSTIVIIAAGMTFADTLSRRVAQVEANIAAVQQGNNDTSLGKRLVIWKVAIGAIGEHPLLGYGPDAPRRLMKERSAQIGGTTIIYSHFHNVILDELVRAGLVGTFALVAMVVVPLVAAVRHTRDRTASIGFGLLICVQIAFLLSGSVNIMLHHDILDAQFLANTVLCLYFVFGRVGRATGDTPPVPDEELALSNLRRRNRQ